MLKFSNDVSLGELIAAGTFFVVAAGLIIPGYMSLATHQAALDAKYSDLVGLVSAQTAAESLRISNDEHRMDQAEQNDGAFQGEQRLAMNHVLDILRELQGLVAKKQDLRPR